MAGGCRQLNASHCGNQDGNATCEQRNPQVPFCDRCEAANDGCVVSLEQIALSCLSETTTGVMSSEESSSTAAPSESSTGATTEVADSSSSGGPNLCGNGLIDDGEACDGELVPAEADCMTEEFGKGIPTCTDDCTMLDYTDCPAYMLCGNGEVGFGEDCDGMNLNGDSCEDFANLTGAGLACDERCMFDLAACLPCVESGEECSPGQSVCCEATDTCGGLLNKECCVGASCPL